MRDVVSGSVSAFGIALGQGIAQGLAMALIIVMILMLIMIIIGFILTFLAILYISRNNKKKARILLAILFILTSLSFILRQEWLFGFLILYCSGVFVVALFMLFKSLLSWISRKRLKPRRCNTIL